MNADRISRPSPVRIGIAWRFGLVVESRPVGGECSYYACMPTKTMLRGAELSSSLDRAPGMTPERPEQAGVWSWRDAVTSNWDDHSVNSHIFHAYDEKLPSFDHSVSALIAPRTSASGSSFAVCVVRYAPAIKNRWHPHFLAT